MSYARLRDTASTSPSKDTESLVPLHGPTPLEVKGRGIFDPKPNLCFSCNPVYTHDRNWIRPECPPQERNLILCFDGTGDSFDEDNSNVVQLLAMMKKDEPEKQLVYYQAGIGTYTSHLHKSRIIEATCKLVDMMSACELPKHVKDGYLFLMQNYRAGDQICIFGFSRGAFTARALAGMLQKVGLLPPSNLEQLPFAYDMYARDDAESVQLSFEFKRAFSIDVRIKFLGVWDTVESVGFLHDHLPLSGSNSGILYLRHALALDERRAKFLPLFCTGGSVKVQGENPEVPKPAEVVGMNIDPEIGSWKCSRDVREIIDNETDVEEVFFAGAHCDVGGGSVKNGKQNSLARIPLRWMIRECFKNKVGIIFDECMLKNEVGFDIESTSEAQRSISAVPEALPSSNVCLARPQPADEPKGLSFPKAILYGLSSPFLWVWGSLSDLRVQRPLQVRIKKTKSRRAFTHSSEAQEELADATSPIYDQLKKKIRWKIMEYIPWVTKKSRAEVEGSGSRWAYKIVWNWGEGRTVYRQVMRRGMKVHRSVKIRMLAQPMEGKNEKKYLPQIRVMIDGECKPRRLTREEWLADKPPFGLEWVK